MTESKSDSPPKQIFQLMPKLMAALGAIPKSQRNNGQGYKFRGVDDVLNALHPALVKHGITLGTKVSHHSIGKREEKKPGPGDQVRVVYHATVQISIKLYAPDGSFVTVESAGEGMDYAGDKSTNKAMSSAFKYALFLGLAIPLEADAIDDSDADAPPAAKPGPPNKPSGRGKSTTTAKPPAKKPAALDANPKPENPYSENMSDKCDDARRDAIIDLAKKLGMDQAVLKKAIVKRGSQTITGLTRAKADELLAAMQTRLEGKVDGVPF